MGNVFKKNIKDYRMKMNLFVSYTPEETKFLLEIVNKTVEIKHDIFTGVNKDKMGYYKIRKVLKKEIIKDYDFIFVKKGKIAVIENGKIIKTIKEDECFGFSKKYLNKAYTLLAVEDSEIVFFDIGEDIVLAQNLLKYLTEHANGYSII